MGRRFVIILYFIEQVDVNEQPGPLEFCDSILVNVVILLTLRYTTTQTTSSTLTIRHNLFVLCNVSYLYTDT
jgi:hypothetical protein